MKTCLALAMMFTAATPGVARDVPIGRDRYAVAVRGVDVHPTTPATARRTLDRIDQAAMAACGASGFSLSEVNRSVRHSACWHDAVADAVRRIDDPLLSRIWQDR